METYKGEMITYDEILDYFNKNKEEKKHLLLGNGFNLSLGVDTSYEKIFNGMKEAYKDYNELNVENNYDIECIIGKLKNQISKENPQKKFLDKFINNKVKSDFMKSAYTIVKESVKNIYQENNELGILFENFENFFTLNYDPFLYLLLMKYKNTNSDIALSFQNTLKFKTDNFDAKEQTSYKEIKEIYNNYSKQISTKEGRQILNKPFSNLTKADLEKQLKEVLKSKGKKFNKKWVELLYEDVNKERIRLYVNDGFTKNMFNTKQSIGKYIQNVFFLHGAFHIYINKKNIHKITQTQNKALYDKLDEVLGEENKDSVCVFTNDNKISEIEKNVYLKKCLEKLKTLKGSLVIIGSSLDENDKHIFNAIKESILLKKIFYASNHLEKKKHHERISKLFPTKKIVLFDRETITYKKADA